MEEREPFDKQVRAVDAQLGELEARRRRLVRKFDQRGSGDRCRPRSPISATPGSAGAVPEQLLAAYERLGQRLEGVAVARLTGGRCDGCHLSLPAVELDRIRHEAAGHARILRAVRAHPGNQPATEAAACRRRPSPELWPDEPPAARPARAAVGGTEVMVGTCSWTDPTLTKQTSWYPRRSMSAEDRLRYYAGQFPVVEADVDLLPAPDPGTGPRPGPSGSRTGFAST